MAGPNQRKGDTHRDSQKEKVSHACVAGCGGSYCCTVPAGDPHLTAQQFRKGQGGGYITILYSTHLQPWFDLSSRSYLRSGQPYHLMIKGRFQHMVYFLCSINVNDCCDTRSVSAEFGNIGMRARGNARMPLCKYVFTSGPRSLH